MRDSIDVPVRLLVLVALLQGLALVLLHQSMALEFWPHREPQWLFALYSVALPVPLVLLLGLESRNFAAVARWTAGLALVLFGLGYYVGSQATPLEHVDYGYLLGAYVVTACVATFKALMYVQHVATGEPLSYHRLFLLSWRNFLTLGLSLLFGACVWGVLRLWAGLFGVIGIDFFTHLFGEPWFYYPVLALANGFGVVIFRRQSQVIDAATRIQQALMKFLLVILVFVSIIFLVALPFTGLQPLWESGGSTLILWMQALMLFFLNAVYQDDPGARPYPLWLHRFLYLGIAVLPVYSLISCYGLTLRVEQYGWTVSRCWAFLMWGLFALFSAGYLVGIIRYRDDWLRQLSWVNVRMGLLVLGLMLLVNSPLLDFRKISLDSQLGRLERGEVSLEDFDYRYLRYQLVGPGYRALQELKQEVLPEHPAVALRIDALYADFRGEGIETDRAALLSAIQFAGESYPEPLGDAIFGHLTANPGRLGFNQSYHLFPIDLDQDSDTEYLLVEQGAAFHRLTLFYRQDTAWRNASLTPERVNPYHPQELIEALEGGEFRLRPPRWRELEADGTTYRVR